MKEKKYISLVHKHLTHQLTDEEQAAYDVMLEAVENRELADQMAYIWDKSADYKPTSFKPNTAAAFHKFKTQIADEAPKETAKVIRMNPIMWVSRIAAASIFVLAALFLFNTNKSTSFETTLATSSEIQSTQLSDGTVIWLDEHSSIEVASSFGEDTRTVRINGSGYFDVSRDEAHPFIVEMGENRLEVLGTAFNIDNSDSERVLVEVESGVVKVKTATKDAILKANESATLLYSDDKIITSDISDSRVFNWYKKANLDIDNLPIQKVVDRIEEHYGVEIALSSNVNTSCTLTSPLMEGNSLEDIFAVLSATYDMSFEESSNDSYLIKYLSCK